MRQYSGTGVVFQSTHPSGVRPDTVTRHQNSSDFNPRTPVGCDACRCAAAWSSAYFNPRTPVGCDCHCDLGEVAAFHISIHAPQWGATWRLWQHLTADRDFNPRTPVGCDVPAVLNHSPTTLFQSTHPSGVRLSYVLIGSGETQFQSTHPSGVRRPAQVSARQRQSISIHAPQWGATIKLLLDASHSKFQSTHPSGVRRNGHCNCLCHKQFQSTHPSGVRLANWLTLCAPCNNFNPRTPVGCDCIPACPANNRSHFNPRTPVGCDPARLQDSGSASISIHAPQWGATEPEYQFTK